MNFALFSLRPPLLPKNPKNKSVSFISPVWVGSKACTAQNLKSSSVMKCVKRPWRRSALTGFGRKHASSPTSPARTWAASWPYLHRQRKRPICLSTVLPRWTLAVSAATTAITWSTGWKPRMPRSISSYSMRFGMTRTSWRMWLMKSSTTSRLPITKTPLSSFTSCCSTMCSASFLKIYPRTCCPTRQQASSRARYGVCSMTFKGMQSLRS